MYVYWIRDTTVTIVWVELEAPAFLLFDTGFNNLIVEGFVMAQKNFVGYINFYEILNSINKRSKSSKIQYIHGVIDCFRLRAFSFIGGRYSWL